MLTKTTLPLRNHCSQFARRSINFLLTFLFSISFQYPGYAQTIGDSHQSTDWAAAAVSHAQSMRSFHDTAGSATQHAPPLIPTYQLDRDPNGKVGSYQPERITRTIHSPFFQNLGTNGRTCFTCHQPQNGWTISPKSVQERFDRSAGNDPLFRLVDGATCPSDDISSLAAKTEAYKLVREKGLIRIGLAMPANTQFEVLSVTDPYNCTTNPSTGLTSSTTGIVSVYRRPLPTTNLPFLSTIMWDGREPDLAHQSVDATLIHAQGNSPGPSADQQKQMVSFETGIFTAQVFDHTAHLLHAKSGILTVNKPTSSASGSPCADTSVAQMGGPVSLANLAPLFFIGINDPLGFNPCGTDFTSDIFNLYQNWADLSGNSPLANYRKSIARGEKLFNTRPIAIQNVGGLNDVTGISNIPGFCGTCHDTPNVGDHSVKAPLNIGVTDAVPPALDVSGLPVFTLKCNAGPLAGQIFTVTDPGRALISGNCADIGKTKGPILRGLAARAPYFHNGSATTLMDAVNFYDQRFNIGFTDDEKQDLVNFLNTL
jgi:cytochrome c peroxidase